MPVFQSVSVLLNTSVPTADVDQSLSRGPSVSVSSWCLDCPRVFYLLQTQRSMFVSQYRLYFTIAAVNVFCTTVTLLVITKYLEYNQEGKCKCWLTIFQDISLSAAVRDPLCSQTYQPSHQVWSSAANLQRNQAPDRMGENNCVIKILIDEDSWTALLFTITWNPGTGNAKARAQKVSLLVCYFPFIK